MRALGLLRAAHCTPTKTENNGEALKKLGKNQTQAAETTWPGQCNAVLRSIYSEFLLVALGNQIKALR